MSEWQPPERSLPEWAAILLQAYDTDCSGTIEYHEFLPLLQKLDSE